MEAPPGGMSVEEFNEFLRKERESRYEKREDKWFCKKCGTQVQQTTCFVSEHDASFGETHAGSGSVQTIPLPYCPRCESEPKSTSTCAHMDLLLAEVRL